MLQSFAGFNTTTRVSETQSDDQRPDVATISLSEFQQRSLEIPPTFNAELWVLWDTTSLERHSQANLVFLHAQSPIHD
jgi:hypothetical protein